MIHKQHFATALLLATLALPGLTHAQNGVMRFEFPFSIPGDHPLAFVDCLGEGLTRDGIISQITHLVVTPSGKEHLMDNWNLEGLATGFFSGRTWYFHGTSPLVINARGDQHSENGLVHLTYEPLDGGPKLKSSQTIRLVTDANGHVRVEEFEFEQFRCIGKPN